MFTDKGQKQTPCIEKLPSVSRHAWSFTPFAMETIGIWGGKANSLLPKLVTVWANSNGCTKGEAALLCRSRLQLALLRGLARQKLERASIIIRSWCKKGHFI